MIVLLVVASGIGSAIIDGLFAWDSRSKFATIGWAVLGLLALFTGFSDALQPHARLAGFDRGWTTLFAALQLACAGMAGAVAGVSFDQGKRWGKWAAYAVLFGLVGACSLLQVAYG